jgi:hypothetical protein
MTAETLLVGLLLAMPVAGFAMWMAWRVVRVVMQQRRLELAWRERLAVWNARAGRDLGPRR